MAITGAVLPEAVGTARSRRLLLRRIVFVAGVVLLAIAVVPGLLSRSPSRGLPIAEVDQSALEAKIGIHLEHLAVSADGGILDLRYWVVDASRAMALHDADVPVRVTLEADGTTSERPWMGHGPHNMPEAGHTYYLLLLNEGDLVQPGSVVSIELAGVTLPHVRAE